MPQTARQAIISAVVSVDGEGGAYGLRVPAVEREFIGAPVQVGSHHHDRAVMGAPRPPATNAFRAAGRAGA